MEGADHGGGVDNHASTSGVPVPGESSTATGLAVAGILVAAAVAVGFCMVWRQLRKGSELSETVPVGGYGRTFGEADFGDAVQGVELHMADMSPMDGPSAAMGMGMGMGTGTTGAVPGGGIPVEGIAVESVPASAMEAGMGLEATGGMASAAL